MSYILEVKISKIYEISKSFQAIANCSTVSLQRHTLEIEPIGK